MNPGKICAFYFFRSNACIARNGRKFNFACDNIRVVPKCAFSTAGTSNFSEEVLIGETATEKQQVKVEKRNETTSPELASKSKELPKLWEDPIRYAYNAPLPAEPEFTEIVESSEEWPWVERLFPQKIIPDVPLHQNYPTPSGWMPPRDPPLDLPYYVRRTPFHVFPLHLECRRDQLDPKTMEFNYVELVIVRGIEGDVFACEKDLKCYLEEKLGRKVATHVNEPQGKIRVKGADRTLLEQFLLDRGF